MNILHGPYSPSRLDVSVCPHRFNQQYIQKLVKDEGSVQSRRGNVVHETFEEIIKGWLVNKPLEWPNVQKYLIEKMSKYHLTSGDDQELCIQACKKFMEVPMYNTQHILGTEELMAVKWADDKFSACDYNDPNAYARGKIDVLMIDDNNDATIIDHKTQMYVMPHANTFQLGFYAWIVKKCYPYVQNINTIVHYAHPSIAHYSKPYSWSREDLAAVEDTLIVRVGIIEQMTDFPAIAGHHCIYCPLKGECPKLEDMSKRMTMKKAKGRPIVSAKDAQEHAEVLTVIVENEGEIKDKLKSYVAEIGSVVIPGMEYAFEPSETFEIPQDQKEPLFNKIKGLGIDPFLVFSCSMTEMKKLGKYLTKEQLESLKIHMSPKVKTTFKGRKV